MRLCSTICIDDIVQSDYGNMNIARSYEDFSEGKFQTTFLDRRYCCFNYISSKRWNWFRQTKKKVEEMIKMSWFRGHD